MTWRDTLHKYPAVFFLFNTAGRDSAYMGADDANNGRGDVGDIADDRDDDGKCSRRVHVACSHYGRGAGMGAAGWEDILLSRA